MQIDESDEQNQNAYLSIRESLQSDSNLTLESAVHPLKQPWQRSSTDDGIQIDENDEQDENAYFSIRERLQPDSNLTLESAVHPLKQNSQRSSTDDGMQIDESDEQDLNAYIVIVAEPKTIYHNPGPRIAVRLSSLVACCLPVAKCGTNQRQGLSAPEDDRPGRSRG
jgi:hypothetical protein